MKTIVGTGRVLLWAGGSLWMGRATGLSDLHAHHAIQVSLATRGRFAMSEGRGEWHEHAGAIVMPDRAHRFDGRDSGIAQLFVEPETAAGRALVARFGSRDISDLPPEDVEALVSPLRAAFDAEVDDATLVAHGQRVVAQLASTLPAGEAVDPRITRVVEWLRERLQSPVSLAEAAAKAHLSPSRFRHLFVAQTGVSFRAYLLWARVGAAMGAGMSGRSWTEAAQEAGFADSAHFSRTCRRMFGIAPAMLVRA